MQKIVTNPFFEVALREVPRLLGQIDRNPMSPTYGSCDRAFWLYRTNDISSMRYQETALTLALLYTTSFTGNPYFRDEHVLSLAKAAVLFACNSQHADGTFDEWYINEGSFVCTAFVTAALCETVIILGDELEGRNKVVAALRKSGAWLSHHTETLVVNQLAGAVSALNALFTITGDTAFRTKAEEKCATVLSLQHTEGWWGEYGGPDAGYLSLTIDYLSRYAERTNDMRVYSAIEKASAFLVRLINPDGTAGGEYLSRNTEYLIPSGFLRSAPHSETARVISGIIAGLCSTGKGITPRSLDDRYICYILYNWLEAGVLWTRLRDVPTSLDMARGRSFFPDAGLCIERNDGYQLFVNLQKGGSLRLYSNGSVLIDSGITVRTDGAVYAGNVLDAATHFSYDESSSTLRSEGRLIRVWAPLLTTGRAILLKAAQWVFGPIPLVQSLLKRLLRMRSVLRPGSRSDLQYERIVVLGVDTVVITDILHDSVPRECIVVGEVNIYALVPSSRYVADQPYRRLKPRNESYEMKNGVTCVVRTFGI